MRLSKYLQSTWSIAFLSYLLLSSTHLSAESLLAKEVAIDDDKVMVVVSNAKRINQDKLDVEGLTEQRALAKQTSELSEAQMLIDAQIDDVFDSAEFLQMAQDEALDQPLYDSKTDEAVNAKASSDEPEDLLNELDGSDLMDYVAEDDLWKEQLTIEDEP
jgi:hypothetical protein